MGFKSYHHPLEMVRAEKRISIKSPTNLPSFTNKITAGEYRKSFEGFRGLWYSKHFLQNEKKRD